MKEVFYNMLDHRIAKRNLRVMWFANFFVGSSMTMILPFISLYISLHSETTQMHIFKNGQVCPFAITFLTAFIFAPIWGRIGDKYGRKKILIFSGLGLCNLPFFYGICFICLGVIYVEILQRHLYWLYPDFSGLYFNTNT